MLLQKACFRLDTMYEPLAQIDNNEPTVDIETHDNCEILLFKPVINKNKRQDTLNIVKNSGNKMARVDTRNRYDPFSGLPTDGGNNTAQPGA